MGIADRIRVLNFGFLCLSVVLSLGLIAGRRRVPGEYVIYAMLSVLLIVARDSLQATMRFMLPVFPLAAVAASWLRRRPEFYDLILIVSAVMQGFFFLGFASGADWAGT